MKPMIWVMAAALCVVAVATGSPGYAGQFDANRCFRESADGVGGRIFTNSCRSLVHVGSCYKDGPPGSAWSCEYAMYSEGETFRSDAQRQLRFLACRGENGLCVQAVKCLRGGKSPDEAGINAFAKTCRVEF